MTLAGPRVGPVKATRKLGRRSARIAGVEWHEAMPFAGLLAIEPVGDQSAEEVRARLAWRQELCTAGGLMHGGPMNQHLSIRTAPMAALLYC